MLRRMKPFVPKHIMITVYKSLVLPYFDYCSLVWDNCSTYLLDKIQKMQNRASRIITGRSYETRSSDLLQELNWQTLKERRKEQKTIFMFKIRNRYVPENMANMFEILNNERYNLRRNDNSYQIDKPKQIS